MNARNFPFRLIILAALYQGSAASAHGSLAISEANHAIGGASAGLQSVEAADREAVHACQVNAARGVVGMSIVAKPISGDPVCHVVARFAHATLYFFGNWKESVGGWSISQVGDETDSNGTSLAQKRAMDKCKAVSAEADPPCSGQFLSADDQ